MSAFSVKILGLGCKFWRILYTYNQLAFCILHTKQT